MAKREIEIHSTMQLVLYEPEIPQNAGTLARMCTCLNIDMGIIEPASFQMTDRQFKRAGMDYINFDKIKHYTDFKDFREKNKAVRIILLDTRAPMFYFDLEFRQNDIILAGKESTGVPKNVYDLCDKSVKIPMIPNARSLNVAISAAIVVSEAHRQLRYSSVLNNEIKNYT